VKIKGPPRTFPCTAQIIWNPGSAAASPTPAESSTQPAEKQSVYGEESGGRMLMSPKKTLPLRAAGRYTSRGHPAEAVLQQKRYEKMCMLQRVSGNLIGCVEPIGNKYHGTNPKSFAKETPPT